MEITPGNQKIENSSVPAVEDRPPDLIPSGGEADGTTIRALLLESRWICSGVDNNFKLWTKVETEAGALRCVQQGHVRLIEGRGEVVGTIAVVALQQSETEAV